MSQEGLRVLGWLCVNCDWGGGGWGTLVNKTSSRMAGWRSAAGLIANHLQGTGKIELSTQTGREMVFTREGKQGLGGRGKWEELVQHRGKQGPYILQGSSWPLGETKGGWGGDEGGREKRRKQRKKKLHNNTRDVYRSLRTKKRVEGGENGVSCCNPRWRKETAL